MPWYKQKTTWTGIAGVLSAVGGFLLGELTLQVALPLFFTSLIGIFLRQGVEKIKNGG